MIENHRKQQRNTSTEANRIDRRSVRLDRPLGAQLPPEPLLAELVLTADQEAINDHGSGAYDEFSLLAAGPRLPFDELVDSDTEVLRSLARQRSRDDRLVARALLLGATTQGVLGRGLDELSAQSDRLVTQLALLTARRAEHVAVLEGRQEDRSGRNRTGPVPTTRRVWWWKLRSHLLTMGVGLLELLALYEVFAYLLSVDDPQRMWTHPGVLATALIGAVVIIGLPIMLGVMLQGVRRGAEPRPLHTVGRVVQFAVVFAGWVAAVVLMSIARAEQFGSSSSLSLESGTGGIDWNMTGLLFVVFFLLGMLTMWLHSRHNWHADEVVLLNAAIFDCEVELMGLRAEMAETEALVESQQLVCATEPEAWREHIDVTLPAMADLRKRRYRLELARRAGDPGFTGALGTVHGNTPNSAGQTDSDSTRRSALDAIPEPAA